MAATAIKLTAKDLKNNELIDVTVKEPLRGAHRDNHKMAMSLRDTLSLEIEKLTKQPQKKVLENRHKKILSFGQFK